MAENSGVAGGFTYKKTDAQKETQVVEEKTDKVVENPTSPVKEESDFNEPYFEQRTVTIALVKNYSLFRRANEKVMPKRTDYIGSSITSSRVLCANKGEVEAYMPNIIGLAPNNENFVTRVKQYFNNIQIPVNELNKTFDIGFHYNTKREYYEFKRREDKINENYDSVDRKNLSALREALKDKINKLNNLESEKYLHGYPNNTEDYLMYRHCLLYNDIAKDIAFINSDKNIRFYFKDDKKEAEKAAKQRYEINKAKSNYLSCLNDDELFNAVYIGYCVSNSLPVVSSISLNRIEQENRLDKFSSEEPAKFNKIFSNKDVKLIGTIEMLIARGELIRYANNQNIVTPTGEFIGANMTEAISWFKNPDNNGAATAFYDKLKKY